MHTGHCHFTAKATYVYGDNQSSTAASFVSGHTSYQVLQSCCWPRIALQASLLVADAKSTFWLMGNGDVLESVDGIMGKAAAPIHCHKGCFCSDGLAVHFDDNNCCWPRPKRNLLLLYCTPAPSMPACLLLRHKLMLIYVPTIVLLLRRCN